MNTIGANTNRSFRRVAVIAIVGTLALSFAALATLGAETGSTGDGIFASMGDYIAKVAEALGSG